MNRWEKPGLLHGPMGEMILKDKNGEPFEVIRAGVDRLKELLEFYDQFEPKGQYQGIPPSHKSKRKRWVRDLLEQWENFLIIKGGGIIGHLAFTHLSQPAQELIIFIHQGHRGRGIGSEAIRAVCTLMSRGHIECIWLTVQNTNIPAIRCFRKVGFEFTSPPLEPEREMRLQLKEMS